MPLRYFSWNELNKEVKNIMKSIDTGALRANAKAYMDCVEYCSNMLTRMDREHGEMVHHWQGGAQQGYMQTYDGVVKPAIEKMIEGCTTCCENLIAYAEVCDERDQADKAAFGQ